MIVRSVRENVLPETVSKDKIEENFKKALFDLQNHAISIQTSWSSMFIKEYDIIIRKTFPEHRKADRSI